MPAYNLKQPVVVDVYEGEAPVRWEPVYRAILKASGKFSDGYRRQDYQVENYAAQCRALEIKIGLYHFLLPNNIAEQAELFLSVWKKLGGADMPPIADVECDPGIWNVGHAAWAGQVRTFLDLLELGTGDKPIVYTSEKYWYYTTVDDKAQTWTDEYPLWVAQYPYSQYVDVNDAPAKLPQGWTKWALWQYADDGRTQGYFANDFNTVADWYKPILDQFQSIPPIGGDVNAYKITPIYTNGSAIRPAPNTNNTKIGTLSYGKYASGNEVFGDGTQEQWLHILEADGNPIDGWIAAKHAGKAYATLTQVSVPPTEPPAETPTVTVTLNVDGATWEAVDVPLVKKI